MPAIIASKYNSYFYLVGLWVTYFLFSYLFSYKMYNEL